MKVSVIIPTYNRAYMICETIMNLFQQDFPKENFEIIVVNNNSSDNTLERLRNFTIEYNGKYNVSVVNECRIGDVYARNTGAAVAHGEYLFFTDDDANFDTNWISCMVQILDEYPRVAMVGSRIEILWDEKPEAWIKQYEYLLGQISKGDSGYIISSKGFCIPNGSLAIRKKVFLEVGGNNPGQIGEYLVGNGEVGLFNKVKALGYQVAFTDDTTMWHLQTKKKNATHHDILRRLENCAISDAYTDVVERNVVKYRNVKRYKMSMLKNLLFIRRARFRRSYFRYKSDLKYNEFVDKYSDQKFLDSIKIEDCVLNETYFIPPIIYQTAICNDDK